jgi:hypothetical protein
MPKPPKFEHNRHPAMEVAEQSEMKKQCPASQHE